MEGVHTNKHVGVVGFHVIRGRLSMGQVWAGSEISGTTDASRRSTACHLNRTFVQADLIVSLLNQCRTIHCGKALSATDKPHSD